MKKDVLVFELCYFILKIHVLFNLPKYLTSPSEYLVICHFVRLGYSRGKKNKKNSWGWGRSFLKTLMEFFRVFTVPLEIPDKTKLQA